MQLRHRRAGAAVDLVGGLAGCDADLGQEEPAQPVGGKRAYRHHLALDLARATQSLEEVLDALDGGDGAVDLLDLVARRGLPERLQDSERLAELVLQPVKHAVHEALDARLPELPLETLGI